MPAPARGTAACLLAITGLLLVLAVGPAQGNHVQTDSGKAIAFDHLGSNEWWVELAVSGQDAGQATGIEVASYPASSSMWRPMTWNADWGKWTASYHVPPGDPVKFRATWAGGAMQSSCWFSHPQGAEACGGAGSPFDATFTGVRGNEWWEQVSVSATGGTLAKVDVRLNSGTWQPMAKESYGWTASIRAVQGTIVQVKATSTTGAADLSDCYRWIPPANTDATKVACSGSATTTSTTSTTGSAAFDATFSGVKGNDWWVQASVGGNQPIQNVDARVNCSEEWRSLKKESYGWAASFPVPSGSKVDFRAISTSGNMDFSGGYIWPQATPTSAC